MASETDDKRAKIGNLGLVWRHAARDPKQIAAALFFLCLSSAAVLAIPYGFKRVIDQGFGSGGAGAQAVGTAFHYLLMIVVVLAAATALRVYFVSWLGERTIADLRVAIDQARLLTLHAAWQIDKVGARGAQRAIAAIKLVVPNMLQRVVDEAMQLFGAAGLAHDLPLAAFFVQARALRIADGPDEVHAEALARMELGKYEAK